MTQPLHVETSGSGPDLVLLHGWGMHGGVWGDFTLRLGESYRVHVIDLPGHGFSAPQTDLTAVGLLTALLDQAPPKAIWLGWSLGGTLAALLAEQHTEHVRGLILLACNPCFVRRPDWPWGMEEKVFDPFAAEMAANAPVGLRRFSGLLCKGLDDPRLALKTLRERLETRPAPDPQALTAGLDWLRQLDARPVLSRLSCPVLLLGGERDALVPFAALEALTRRNPSFRLGRIAGASHLPFLSHAKETLAELPLFLDGCARRP